jgi:hypothetical protein
VSGLSCVALFKWADLNVDVVIATLLWVGTRATGITSALCNDVVDVYCTSSYDALWMLSYPPSQCRTQSPTAAPPKQQPQSTASLAVRSGSDVHCAAPFSRHEAAEFHLSKVRWARMQDLAPIEFVSRRDGTVHPKPTRLIHSKSRNLEFLVDKVELQGSH